jgi:hypothetical protein
MTLNRSAPLASAFEDVPVIPAHHPFGTLAWQTLAACGARADLPWTADEVGTWDAETMRAVCAGCPVLTDCASFVDRTYVCAGWWAGHDRDPDHAEPPAPAWVPVTVHRHQLPGVEQGVLPLGGAA